MNPIWLAEFQLISLSGTHLGDCGACLAINTDKEADDMPECLMCGRQMDNFRFGPREPPLDFICDKCWRGKHG